MPFLSPNQQCQSTEALGKISHSMDLLTPSSLGVFQLCLWPLIAPRYLGEGLPCLSSALWCQYPKFKYQPNNIIIKFKYQPNDYIINAVYDFCLQSISWYLQLQLTRNRRPPRKHVSNSVDEEPDANITRTLRLQNSNQTRTWFFKVLRTRTEQNETFGSFPICSAAYTLGRVNDYQISTSYTAR